MRKPDSLYLHLNLRKKNLHFKRQVSWWNISGSGTLVLYLYICWLIRGGFIFAQITRAREGKKTVPIRHMLAHYAMLCLTSNYPTCNYCYMLCTSWNKYITDCKASVAIFAVISHTRITIWQQISGFVTARKFRNLLAVRTFFPIDHLLCHIDFKSGVVHGPN